MLNWLKNQFANPGAPGKAGGCCGGGCGGDAVGDGDVIRGLEAGMAALERELEFERRAHAATLGCVLAAVGGSVLVPDAVAERVLSADFTVERHPAEGGEVIRLATGGAPE